MPAMEMRGVRSYPLRNLGQAAAPAPGSREELLKALVRQAERYHFASLQDENLVVAARHNAYASGILGVVTEQSDEAEIQAVVGTSLKALRDEVYQVQDKLELAAFDLLKNR